MKKIFVHLITTRVKNKSVISLFILGVLFLFLFVFFKSTLAQDISLGVSPPILEVMIKPGKEINQKYLISNSGRETPLLLKIVPFSPQDAYGNVKFEDMSVYENIDLLSWFKIGDSPISNNARIFLPRGGNQEITLNINPPENAPQGDYYLTLLFETDLSNTIGKQGSSSNAQIGTNILLTISKDGNPKKDAEVSEFSAPKIIDSLGTITYTLNIKNIGNAFFKPVGDITVNPSFGSDEKLTIAPLNILASSVREIPCTQDEQLVRCTLPKKVFFGIYHAKLKFTLDDGSQSYEASTLTFAFPFSIAIAFVVVLILIKIITSTLKRQY